MPDTLINGALRDSSGALVAVMKDQAKLPLQWVHGYLLDADYALVIVRKSS